MPGEQTRRAIAAQPEWLRGRCRPIRRFPRRRAAALHRLRHVVPRGADGRRRGAGARGSCSGPSATPTCSVCVSHEGETPLTLEAARAWPRPAVARHRAGRRRRSPSSATRSSSARRRSRSAGATRRATRARSRRSRRCTARTSAWLPGAVEEALAAPLPEVGAQERVLVAGAGRDWPTAQEAVLKLREGAWVAAEAHQTEQLLHGHLAAVDESVRAFVLEGEGRAAERAAAAAAALRELGCEIDLVPTRHPVVDIVRFQLLTVAIAEQARARAGPDPPRRPALGRGRRGGQRRQRLLSFSGRRGGGRSGAPARSRRSRRSCCRRIHSRARPPARRRSRGRSRASRPSSARRPRARRPVASVADERREAPLQLLAPGREEDEHLGTGLRAELLSERRSRGIGRHSSSSAASRRSTSSKVL